MATVPLLRLANNQVVISNKTLRKKFQELEKQGLISAHEVAIRCGWLMPKRFENETRGDGRKVKRALGLLPEQRHGKVSFQTGVSEAKAVKLAEAMGCDPVDLGF